MSRVRDADEAVPDEAHLPGITYHPRSPSASLEQLDRLAGIIKLIAPVSLDELHRWMEDGEDEEEDIDHAGA